MNTQQKPRLSFWQIWNMSFGFLGIQYGFGLQQANMSPIFRYLGADEANLPILWLAGPITGLLVQPLIGAISDGTWTRFGRRRPFFVIGALIGSVAVLLMPYSPVLWVAASLMWILDAAMNTAMEPYRALIGDNLPQNQRTLGFSVQSFMIGAGQVLANVMPSVLAFVGIATVAASNTVPDFVKYSFVIGVAAMLITVIWTASTTDEYPPENLEEFRKEQAEKGGVWGGFREIFTAVKEMPKPMRQLWWVKFFTWYGLPLMWQYLSLSIARHCYNAPTAESSGFAEGTAMGGIGLMVMNITTVALSFFFPLIVRITGTRMTHAICLAIGGIGFISMLFTTSVYVVFGGMVLVGIAWASIITMPFVMTTAVVPAARIGVYMGLLNAFICIPQIINNLTIGLIYKPILGNDPRNALVLAGICLVLAAGCNFLISKEVETTTDSEDILEAEVTGAKLAEV
jgi:maltose/moltooligosaccharide transporter